MTEMYSKNHAVRYKLHVIKQTVDIINYNDYMLRISHVSFKNFWPCLPSILLFAVELAWNHNN